MNIRTPALRAAVAIALAVIASPTSATQNDCDAQRPKADRPGSATSDAAPDRTAEDTLTDKLATCGSVLNPPPLGDADIVEPTPPVGDDINIHPGAPSVRP